MVVIDCVQSPPADAMRAAGVTGLCRYLSWVQPNTAFKRITQAEFDQLRSDGFEIVLNWEYAATDWLGGATAGAQHAAEAAKQARALGYPAGCAIPGSCDFDITSTQWNSAGRAYAQAYSAGIRAGGYVAGVYGPWDVLTWCQQLGGFGMYWQSLSTGWSGGRNARQWPAGHLWQRRSGFIAGFDVDFNDVLQANYGQYGVDAETITVWEEPLYLSKRDGDDTVYLSTGMKSRPLTLQTLTDIIYMHDQGTPYTLALGNNDVEWAGVLGHARIIRLGGSDERDGPVDRPVTVALTDRQFQAVVAGMGGRRDDVPRQPVADGDGLM